MTLLLASLLAVLAAPVVIGVLRRLPGGAAPGFFDGFVTVSIGGLVLLHILPHAAAEGGIWAVVAAIFGVLIPVACEAMVDRRSGRGGRSVTLVVALSGLALHALLDGVALTAGSHGHAHAHDRLLALAVVLHRLPVGIAIWWVVTPLHGRGIAATALSVIAVATTVGFFGAGTVHPVLDGSGWAVFQALVAGALLHVVVGHGRAGPAEREGGSPRARVASVVGGAIAGAALWVLSTAHVLPGCAGGEPFGWTGPVGALAAALLLTALRLGLPGLRRRLLSHRRGGDSPRGAR